MQLSWKVPQHNGGSEVTAYVVEASKAEQNVYDASSVRVDGKSTSCELQELEEGEKYDIRIRAVNEMGAGEVNDRLTSVVVKDSSVAPVAQVEATKKVTLKSGSTLDLKIPITGKPFPTISWKKEGQEVEGKLIKTLTQCSFF